LSSKGVSGKGCVCVYVCVYVPHLCVYVCEGRSTCVSVPISLRVCVCGCVLCVCVLKYINVSYVLVHECVRISVHVRISLSPSRDV
jgi:hypothetical protein